MLAACMALGATASLGAGCHASSDPAQPDTHGAYVFRDPETCRPCHEQHVKDWEGSMHAYAEKDPIFRGIADVQASDFQGEAGQFCTECHTVPGFLLGETPIVNGPGGQHLQKTSGLSTVAERGVSCDVCHSATAVLRDENAELLFKADGRIRGPIDEPVPNPFHESQVSGLHLSGRLCSACHNVKLPFNYKDITLEGTGFEWAEWGKKPGNDKQCQDCHMPVRGTGPAAKGGPDRTLHAHTFVGADIALVDFPDKARQLDLVTKLMASAASLDGEVLLDGSRKVSGFRASITNLAGHALPSGVTTERRVWLEAKVTDAMGVVRYQTGTLDARGDLMDGFPEHSITPDGDPDLWWYGSLVTNSASTAKSKIVEFPHRADAITTNLIGPNATVTKTFALPGLTAGSYTLTMRLLFRSIPPHFMRALEEHPLVKLDPALEKLVPILEIATRSIAMTVP
ncbi:MAG: multiheme c-type cytochrome [Polyangiales bacterium]